MVCDYAGFNFDEALSLDCVTFRMLLVDALIYNRSKTKEGREWLEECWTLKQTKPDRKKLREAVNKKC